MSGNCCSSCGSDLTIPNGNNGANGNNAYTLLSALFVQPAISGNVNITVNITNQFTGLWAYPGQIIYIETGGYYQVNTVDNIGQVLNVTNLGYTGNAAPTTNIASGNGVSPGGVMGLTGPTGSSTNGTTILYNNRPASALVSSGTGLQALDSYNVPANTLQNDGDELFIEAAYSFQNIGGDVGRGATIFFNAVDAAPGFGTMLPDGYLYSRVTITRISPTSVVRNYRYESRNSVYGTVQNRETYLMTPQAVPDVTANIIPVDFSVNPVIGANTVSLLYSKVELKRI